MNVDRVLLSRQEFLSHLRDALETGTGYATGKLGWSEIQRLNYSVAASRVAPNSPILKMLEPNLFFHSLMQSGLFPVDAQFYLRFNEMYGEHLRKLDSVGIFPELLERTQPLLRFYQVHAPLVSYLDQEPDRSVPADESRCYLRFLRGKRVLFISSFAELLCERATRETFEKVWARTGKPWFYPASVDAIEFPFGYTAATHRRYANSLELLEEITSEMERRDFDAALIAAGGLGIPIASHAKYLGKVGISLGGHLQALFGIQGKRWRENVEYVERYINDCWIAIPERYELPEKDVADNGAYW